MAEAMSRCAMEKGQMGNINAFADTGPCAETESGSKDAPRQQSCRASPMPFLTKRSPP
jgi:hypothetical protein